MGFYVRKSLKAGPFRFNLSKSGVGVSAGVPGLGWVRVRAVTTCMSVRAVCTTARRLVPVLGARRRDGRWAHPLPFGRRR
jgi:hypothetical protein